MRATRKAHTAWSARWACWAVAPVIAWTTASATMAADVTVGHADLQAVVIDSVEKESFLGIKADTTGRLFVGGREAVFVYEPLADGDYGVRREVVRLPDHSWVHDIEIRGDDLYILTVSALYVIPGGRVGRDDLEVRRVLWGVPRGHVHQCFHGMAAGPEGDLYVAMGDPLWYYGNFRRPDHFGHWTFFSRRAGAAANEEWQPTPYVGTGAVLRYAPDRGGLRVVAEGLRNGCGLAFDRHWNLFSNDNDHESLAADYVPGRLHHVTPHAWFGWPRGWMLTKTPDRLDLLETMNTNLGRFVPVGQTYYDDAFLPDPYRNALVLARWCTRQVTYYPLEPHGATFRCREETLVTGSGIARPVQVAVGRGGRIFATICHMAQNEASPVYRSDIVMITRADDTPARPFEAYDVVSLDTPRLLDELAHPSWSRRREAHLELLRRPRIDVAEIVARWDRAETEAIERVHLVWLVGLRADEATARDRLTRAAADTDPAIRVQAVRCLTERFPQAIRASASLLRDPDPRVQLAAVLACFAADDAVGDPAIRDAILAGPARSDATYLRQAACRLLAAQAADDQLAEWSHTSDPALRLAAVLAAGFRLTLPPATEPPRPDAPLVPWANPETSYRIPYADETVDLREHGRLGTFTIADHWKAGPHTPRHERLFAMLADRLADDDARVRLQAAHFLAVLADPRSEPRIRDAWAQVRRERLARAKPVSVTTAWAAGPCADGGPAGWDEPRPCETAAFDPAATLPAGPSGARAWRRIDAGDDSRFDLTADLGAADDASSYLFFQLESNASQEIDLRVRTESRYRIFLNGTRVANVSGPAGSRDRDVPLTLRPGSNDVMIRVQAATAGCAIAVSTRSATAVTVELPEPLEGPSLADRLKQAVAAGGEPALDPLALLALDWQAEAARGDPERGKRLFAAGGLGCAKCHAIRPDSAGGGGPSLAGAGSRFTIEHLVESILLPGKTVAPIFKATTVITDDGRSHTGLVIGATADAIEMLLPDTTTITIPTAEVEERVVQDVSPMPAGLVRTAAELRDLVAYLLQPQP